MRPSDENQAGSHPNVHPHLRPNLMSSARRSGHEDSILAKLEREPARRARQGNGLRLAWYGGAALVAVGLTATLAWLAAGTGAQAQGPGQGPGQGSEGGPAIVAAPGLEPAASPPMPTPALIVDSAHDPAPPLRMLDTPITKAPLQAAPPTVVAAPPEPVRGPRIAAKPEPVPESKPEARTTSRSAASAKPRSVARSGGRPTSQQQRTINPARNNEHDDSDVALISAVISHANGHAGGDNGGSDEKASSCADDACRSRPARQ